ncbi:MAG: hypothetical protein JXQ75_00430 [Phycisphaerae bacterium]|nr:hypothetical protein [Phycisphaerae bacterium]
MREDHRLDKGACRIVCCALMLSVCLATGCRTSSEGIDLTERGVLTLMINRVSESTVATATAQVTDNNILSIPGTQIVLADDQVLSINDVPLTATALTILGLDATVSATIEAADAPDTYTISFDNQGVTTTFETTPPKDFTEVTPEPSAEVSRDGFELTWEPSDDDGVTVTVTISGSGVSYAEDGSAQVVDHVVTLSDLADDGAVTIGSTQLYEFVNGDITVAVTRVKSVSQKLGFSGGTIRMEIGLEISLTLVEADTD